MGLREIRHQIARLCWRLLVGTFDGVPEWNQICEFDRRATVWTQGKSEGFEQRIIRLGELEEVGASFASTQWGPDTPGDKCFSASDVARVIGPNSSATISNILVLGTENSTPLKRMEIRLADPNEVLATLNSLTVALQRSGVDFCAVGHPAIPATEIWLTTPLHDGKKTLLSCGAMVGVPLAQQVVAQAGSSRNQAQ